MEDEKDRFGEKIRLLERAKEDIYFAAKDHELIEKLRARLRKVEAADQGKQTLLCPKCPGRLQTYSFLGFLLDRCQGCGGVWLDKGELDGILQNATRGPLPSLLKWLLALHDCEREKEGEEK